MKRKPTLRLRVGDSTAGVRMDAVNDTNKWWETVKILRVCYNCLGRAHNSRSCPSKRGCKSCNSKRHTTLHRESTAPPPSVPTSESHNIRCVKM